MKQATAVTWKNAPFLITGDLKCRVRQEPAWWRQASPTLGQKDSLNVLSKPCLLDHACATLPQCSRTVQQPVSAGRWDHGYYSNHGGFLSKGRDRGGFFTQTVRMLNSHVWKPAAARLCRLALNQTAAAKSGPCVGTDGILSTKLQSTALTRALGEEKYF